MRHTPGTHLLFIVMRIPIQASMIPATTAVISAMLIGCMASLSRS